MSRELVVTNGNGASRIGLWLSIAISGMVLFTMVGSMFYVAFSTKANSESILAQSTVNQSLTADLNALRLKINTMEVSLNEIETQFCAQDIVRNLMHANDMRIISMLWMKSFTIPLPTDNAYYPTICNRRVN